MGKNAISMIPYVNTVRQGSQIVPTYEQEGPFAGGFQTGRTTFSLGLDLAVTTAATKSPRVRSAASGVRGWFSRTWARLTGKAKEPQTVATGTDLYAFGNKSQPRAPRLDIDVTLDDAGMVRLTDPPSGASTFGDPMAAPLSGQYHRLPAGTRLADLGVVADGVDVGGPGPATHHTVYPTVRMSLEQLTNRFLELPWEHVGKKK